MTVGLDEQLLGQGGTPTVWMMLCWVAAVAVGWQPLLLGLPLSPCQQLSTRRGVAAGVTVSPPPSSPEAAPISVPETSG
jgi:hypothetical protein